MVRKRGIFIPSFFTTANIFCGVISIINSINQNFKKASWLIIAAWFLDVIDGKIARITKTTSDFGIEYDSLADMISFGIAPAMLYYSLFLKDYPLGWVVAFVYILSVAIRLARYNVGITDKSGEKPPYFTGLPSPGAASFLAIFVIVYIIFLDNRTHRTIPFIMNKIPSIIHLVPLLMFMLSFLMLSQLRYSNFSRFKIKKQVPYRLFVLIIFIGLFIWLYPENSIFIILSAYIFSGIIDFFIRIWKISKRGKILRSEDEK